MAVTASGDYPSRDRSGDYEQASNEESGLSANISPKTLTVSGLTASNKCYDATQAATLSGTAALLTPEAPGTGLSTEGRKSVGDGVSVAGRPGGTFAGKDVGNRIAVPVSGNTLRGASLDDCTLAFNAQPGLSANISPKTLTVSGLTASNKCYDATTAATLSGTAALLTPEAPGTGLST